MKQKAFSIIVAVIATLSASHNSCRAQNPSATARKPIICLTYDDGLDSQLKIAIPQLDSFGLKATFFLNSIQGSSQSDKIGQTPEAVLGWKNAALKGHELANHTLFHPCPENLGWSNIVSIETYSVDKILQEIKAQNQLLNLLDTTRKLRAYAFPCNNVMIGKVDYSKALQKENLFRYARGGGDSSSVITDFSKINTMLVPSWHVWTGTTANQLISFAEKVRKSGGLGVYQFHGVDGQVFAVSSNDHREFLQYLVAHKNDFEVLTFSDAMKSVQTKK